jgi:hypothetical protein
LAHDHGGRAIERDIIVDVDERGRIGRCIDGRPLRRDDDHPDADEEREQSQNEHWCHYKR